MASLSFTGAPTGMAGIIPDPSLHRLVGNGCRPVGGYLPAMGISWPDHRWFKPLVRSGHCPPARGVCGLFAEKVPPLVLVELAFLDCRQRHWRTPLCAVGVDPLSPVEFFKGHPFLLSFFCLNLSAGVVVAKSGKPLTPASPGLSQAV